MKTFPTLYQKTATGAIQAWTVAVEADEAFNGVIETRWGQVGGAEQVTRDVVTKGKNAGKKNATTPFEQAVKDAESDWKKKLKSGYVESLEAAQRGEVNEEFVQGGVDPMLAPNKSYPKDPDLLKRIKFPCYYQHKLDGLRFTATGHAGRWSLWSRTRKPIRSVPHIVEALERRFPTGHLKLDGELYNHELADEFEELVSILRQDEPDPEGRQLVMDANFYDVIESDIPDRIVTMDMPYEQRIAVLGQLLNGAERPLVLVDTHEAQDLEHLLGYYEQSLLLKYEGGMAKNKFGKYEPGKRSPNQQKMKEFEDHEFKIVGINDGRGKDAGTVATFELALPCLCCGKGNPANTAKARLKKPYAYRRKLFEGPAEAWKDKPLTTTMKRWTKDGMPYLPVAKAIRDYEG